MGHDNHVEQWQINGYESEEEQQQQDDQSAFYRAMEEAAMYSRPAELSAVDIAKEIQEKDEEKSIMEILLDIKRLAEENIALEEEIGWWNRGNI